MCGKVTSEKYQAVQEESKSQCYCMSLSVLLKTIIIDPAITA